MLSRLRGPPRTSSAASDRDKDKERRKPTLGVGNAASAGVAPPTSDSDVSFPNLNKLANTRGVIFLLVCVSLICCVGLVALLMKQDAMEVPTMGPRITRAPRNPSVATVAPQPPSLREETRDLHPSSSTREPKRSKENTPEKRTPLAATHSPERLDEETLSAAPPPSTKPPQRRVMRGVRSFKYASSHGNPRFAKAFPVARGVYLFAAVANTDHDENHTQAAHLESTPATQRGTHQYVHSRYACLCINREAAGNNTHAILSTVRGDEPTNGNEEVSPRSATAAAAVSAGRNASFEVPVLPGRHLFRLAADQHPLETRALPCPRAYFSSTSLGICDPVLPYVPEEPEPTLPPLIGRVRTPPKPAMVPIGGCPNLDALTMEEMIAKRLFQPAAEDTMQELRARFRIAPSKGAGHSTTAHDSWTYRDASEDLAEATDLCKQCASITTGSGVGQAAPHGEFAPSDVFERVLFSRRGNAKLLRALQSVAKTKWAVVEELLQSTPTADSVNSKKSDKGMATSEDTRRGLAAMATVATRCDKKQRSSHFAECFRAGTRRAKIGNWTETTAAHGHGTRLALWKSDFFSKLESTFPIPSRLMVHTVNVGGVVVCYAAGDMVCDVVGRTGGWEMELMHIVSHAASELRKLTRVAAAALASRESNTLAGQPVGDIESVAPSRSSQQSSVAEDERSLLRGEFAVSPNQDGHNISHLQYLHDDVTFLDIGGNVGVFAVGMWKRGFRTEVFEALPQNVFLLEGSRCMNQAEEFARWEDERLLRLRANVKFVEQEFRSAARRTAAAVANHSSVTETELASLLSQMRATHVAKATAMLPPFYRGDPSGVVDGISVPSIPRFEVHHVALGNGKRGRGGSEGLPFELDTRVKEHPDDPALAAQLVEEVRAVHDADNVNQANSSCVMISEKHNFGDIVILCNDTLVEDAHKSIAAHGAAGARVLGDYLPRGFVHLTSLDKVLDDPKEDIQLANHAMRRRFAWLFDARRNSAASRAEGQHAADSTASLPPPSESPLLSRPKLSRPIARGSTTAALLDFVENSQVVMKIDVEGQEEFVMQGAYGLFHDVRRRPKLVLSEVWRKTNIARYGAMMIGHHGYVGFALADKRFLRTVVDVIRYHRAMPREMDTVIWFVPGYEFLLPGSLIDKSAG